MKYPVRVTYHAINGTHLKLLTLEEANQKFVVINNELVEQDVKPMNEREVRQRLKYSEECLKDEEDFINNVPSADHTKNRKRVKECLEDISVLTEALKLYV